MAGDATLTYVESDRWLEHRHRWVVALLSLSALAAAATVVAEAVGDLQRGQLFALLALTGATALPAVALLPAAEWSPWSPLPKGVAVGPDRLVVDSLVYDFETVDPAVGDPGTVLARPGRHHVLVPMRRDWSLDVRTHAPDAFTRALQDSYRAWAGGRDVPPEP